MPITSREAFPFSKGGDLPREGVHPYLEDWNAITDSADSHSPLLHAPLGASLADGDGLSLVEGVGYATGFGEVTAARITLDPILLGTRLDSFITER